MDVRGHNGRASNARSTRWSVTINLKTVSRATADECIARARQQDWHVFGQLEKGDSGTEHYQLAVQTPQVRFSALKKIFPTAHIEVAKDWDALLTYCQKEETRVEALKEVSTGYITWKQLRDMFAEWLSDQEFEQHSVDHERRLQVWDKFIGQLIENGYEVDLMGMNANYRACIAKYWRHYLNRYIQTDRQTDTQELTLPSLV